MPNIVKNTTFPNLLSLLTPHSCRGCNRIGDPLCKHCKNYIIKTRHNFCPICKKPNLHGECINCQHLPPIFVVGYRSDLVGKLVHDFKYNSLRALALPLAEILDQTIPTSSHHSIFVPLPTASHHVRQRGFSHTELIAKQFVKLRPNCQTQAILIRAKNSVQVGAKRETRLIQANFAYTLSSHTKIDATATYILFDDVWTTGASLQAAYQKLRQLGINKIICALLAVSSVND